MRDDSRHRPESVELAVRADLPVPLGRIRFAGSVDRGRGLAPGVRTIQEHSVIYVTGGTGSFLDGRTMTRHPVGPGFLVTACAGVPHWYGPDPGRTWNLAYVVVDGPVFDLARAEGLLDADRPVRPLGPLPYWSGRFAEFRRSRPSRSITALQDEACRVLALLVEISGTATGTGTAHRADWLDRSRDLLESDLVRRLDMAVVAGEVGLPYETWRKAFRRAVGTTPARYRTEHRITATRELLRYSGLSLREIAELVGFADEHHLSRRFRASTGTSPREFRRRLG